MSSLDTGLLLSAVQKSIPDAVGVAEPHRLTGGASLESWSFDVEMPNGTPRRLVLRRGLNSDDDGPMASVSLAMEARVIRAAAHAGVAVPTIVFELANGDGLGAGYAMDHLDGETIPQRILRDPTLADALRGLAAQCGRALAGIHAVPTQGLEDLPVVDGPATLDMLEKQLHGFGHYSPAFRAALRWLRDRAIPVERPVLIHGDFRHGNLMIDGNGLVAALDWELCHRGDPMEDLGWLCAPSWRFGRHELPVGGFGERPELFEAYQEASGITVDPDRVAFWETVATLKWGSICLMMYTSYATGLDASVERAAIGRRISETEIDLIETIYGLGDSSVDTNGSDEPARDQRLLQTDPSAGELLAAVESFLRNTAIDGLDGRDSFLARVAANAVATVRREVGAGATAAAGEVQRLLALLQRAEVDDAKSQDLFELRRELCQAITAEHIDLADPALAYHLRRSALEAVAIDQPRYATYRKLQAGS